MRRTSASVCVALVATLPLIVGGCDDAERGDGMVDAGGDAGTSSDTDGGDATDGGEDASATDGGDEAECGPASGGGTPGSCTASVTCDGVRYELSCDTAAGSCTCRVDGSPGPESTATDCVMSMEALRECGAPL